MEVCPVFFEAKSNFFQTFITYLQHVLSHSGHVYLAIFTQPYLKVEENHEVLALYNDLARFFTELDSAQNSTLNYLHLSEYGTHREDGNTSVWNLKNGRLHDQDEALVLEVSRYPGDYASFGCAAYACYPGKLFPVEKFPSGAIDYDKLYNSAQKEVKRRGGATICLANDHVLLNSIAFP